MVYCNGCTFWLREYRGVDRKMGKYVCHHSSNLKIGKTIDGYNKIIFIKKKLNKNNDCPYYFTVNDYIEQLVEEIKNKNN